MLMGCFEFTKKLNMIKIILLHTIQFCTCEIWNNPCINTTIVAANQITGFSGKPDREKCVILINILETLNAFLEPCTKEYDFYFAGS